MRLLLSLFLALPIGAASIPCFTVGPVNFTNCQIASTVSGPVGLAPMDFSFVPGSYPEPFFSPNQAVLFVSGDSYILNSAPVEQTVTETLSADFDAPGYIVTGVSMLGTAFGDLGVTENISLIS